MLLTKEVEVRIKGLNTKYWEALGYSIPRYINDKGKVRIDRDKKLRIKVEDLLPSSEAIIQVECDYCGKIIEKKYKDYNVARKSSVIDKDCCYDCRQLKTRESNLVKYGVENTLQRKEVREKVKTTLQERYGVESTFNIPSVRETTIASRKRSYESVKDFIEHESKSGCTLLTPREFYIDTHGDIEIKCECGNTFITSFHIFLSSNKRTCDLCGDESRAAKTRLDGNDVIDWFENTCFIPMFEPEDYKNAKQKLPYICSLHQDKGVQYLSYDNTRNAKGCRYCRSDASANSLRRDGRLVYDYFINRGLEPLFEPNDYENGSTPLSFRCPKHPNEIQEIAYNYLIRKQGNGCAICASKRPSPRRLDGNYVYQCFIDAGYEPQFSADYYTHNSQPLPYVCPQHANEGIKYISYASIQRGRGCKSCGTEKVSGENHYNYKGGISPLHNYLRDKIYDWKVKSLKVGKYKCYITNKKKEIVIHHLYSFSNILDSVLEELDMPLYQQVSQYETDELELITNAIQEKHNNVLGTCLNASIHNLFHSIYGRGNNTPEQFYEFVERWNKGEFKNAGD